MRSESSASGRAGRREEAVSAFREALQENTRARVPLQWAETQSSLGTALAELGEREKASARLTEANAAYREALQEYTRARVPLRWAVIQMNLAMVYGAFYNKDHRLSHLDPALEAVDRPWRHIAGQTQISTSRMPGGCGRKSSRRKRTQPRPARRSRNNAGHPIDREGAVRYDLVFI